jgi:hypothetical protein
MIAHWQRKAKYGATSNRSMKGIPKDVLSKEPGEHMDKVGHFSFLIVKKGATLTSSLQAETAYEKSLFWPRIIRPPMIRKGHVVMDVCNAAGTFERKVISKNFNEDEMQYKRARKLAWGDLWPFPTRIPNKFRKTSLRGKRLW